jgi:hypothetical protein
MPVLDRVAAAAALLAGVMLLVDIVVITIVNDSWGAGDNALWFGFVLLAPIALVLAAVSLSRGHRRRWLVAALLFGAVVALTAALGYLAQALVDAFYDGDNLGLLWEAPNWVSALVFLALGLLVIRRGQSSTPARAR